MLTRESCPSGLRCGSRKAVTVYPVRGFESLALRKETAAHSQERIWFSSVSALFLCYRKDLVTLKRESPSILYACRAKAAGLNQSRRLLRYRLKLSHRQVKYLFVDHIHRVSLQKFLQVVHCDIHQPLSGFLWSPGNVRCDDAAFRA